MNDELVACGNSVPKSLLGSMIIPIKSNDRAHRREYIPHTWRELQIRCVPPLAMRAVTTTPNGAQIHGWRAARVLFYPTEIDRALGLFPKD